MLAKGLIFGPTVQPPLTLIGTRVSLTTRMDLPIVFTWSTAVKTASGQTPVAIPEIFTLSVKNEV